ncbi:hypothetical protein PsYK624_107810 [Phanerochaete sordida]|uniref:Uncharacterized protein n=1 Tax=Phanerochaete sordida TaxID=48140 RepID=A0A9P3GGP3_9APHY|nr:hypothetical protein PsYK624_107810 [Phanerochaete sordida]
MLVLDGLDTVSPALLEHIATTLPGLVGLTLQLSRKRMRKHGVRWPGTAEAYAVALAGCAALEHFGWNHRLVSSASPAAMLHFEEGACEDACVHDEAIDATFDEAEDLACLFAVHCPTLRSLAFHKSYLLAALCSIVHDGRGQISVDVDRAVDSVSWLSKYVSPPPRYDPGPSHAWPLLNGSLSDLNQLNYSVE